MSGEEPASTPTGRLFVVSGPSGVGKGTLLKRLFAEIDNLIYSISATTRLPRAEELEGIHYYFYTREQFEAGIAQSFFFEHAEYNGNYYGTPADKVSLQREQGKDVILEIEVQGAMRVQAQAPDAVLIYIKPPSIDELERRLRARGTETEERILKRLETAREEEKALHRYDYVLVNDDLSVADEVLRAIVRAERKRTP